MLKKSQVITEEPMNITADFWNTTFGRINDILIHGTHIVSNVIENPTSIEKLDKEWFESMFENFKKLYK